MQEVSGVARGSNKNIYMENYFELIASQIIQHFYSVLKGMSNIQFILDNIMKYVVSIFFSVKPVVQ